jgi:hypothetical protein
MDIYDYILVPIPLMPQCSLPCAQVQSKTTASKKPHCHMVASGDRQWAEISRRNHASNVQTCFFGIWRPGRLPHPSRGSHRRRRSPRVVDSSTGSQHFLSIFPSSSKFGALCRVYLGPVLPSAHPGHLAPLSASLSRHVRMCVGDAASVGGCVC